MATSRFIKNRIKATRNIQQITKAMEAVSAVKMKKSEEAAVGVRAYALATLDILKNVRQTLQDDTLKEHFLLNEGKTGRTALVVITSDKGLAGAFNTNIIRKATHYVADLMAAKLHDEASPVDIIAVGKRGRDALKRAGLNVINSFSENGDITTLEEAAPVSDYLYESFKSGSVDKVVIIYTHFMSALKQKVISRTIMPVTVEALEEITKEIAPKIKGVESEIENENRYSEYKFEPSAERILETLVPALIKVQIFQSILEANASEHSSRMIAMKSASDNASDLISTLCIVYNKARQAQITKELTEITAGAEALASN